MRRAEILVTALLALTYMTAMESYGLGGNAFKSTPPYSHDVWVSLSLAAMLAWTTLVVLCFRRSRWLGVGVLASAYFPAITIYYLLNPIIGACAFDNACP